MYRNAMAVIICIFFITLPGYGYTYSFMKSFTMPVAQLDSMTINMVSNDSLSRILERYKYHMNSCIAENYSFYPCELPLFIYLSNKTMCLTNNEKMYISQVAEICVRQQSVFGIQDSVLLARMHNIGLGSLAEESHSLVSRHAIFSRPPMLTYKEKPALLIHYETPPAPSYLISCLLYPVAITLAGSGVYFIHTAAQFSNQEQTGYLYWFGAMSLSVSVPLFKVATQSLLQFRRESEVYRRKYCYTDSIKALGVFRVVEIKKHLNGATSIK